MKSYVLQKLQVLNDFAQSQGPHISLAASKNKICQTKHRGQCKRK